MKIGLTTLRIIVTGLIVYGLVLASNGCSQPTAPERPEQHTIEAPAGWDRCIETISGTGQRGTWCTASALFVDGERVR